MVLSMTGFGQATGKYNDKSYVVEIKSLNGKTSDIRCKLPGSFKEKEMILRKLILKSGYRGKFDFAINIESGSGDDEYGLNKTLFKKYYKELSELQGELGIQSDIMQVIMRIPNVVGAVNEKLEEEEWLTIKQVVEEAVVSLNKFRADEGTAAKADLDEAVENISKFLNEVTQYETVRINSLRERFQKNLEEFLTDEQIDRNRFEQEVIYYLEKLDINEEKVRLSQHCKYFKEVLEEDGVLKGKKLGFIAQEMGREINTLGAKANDKNIQKLVVLMKDSLEKIKEQVANIV